MIVDNCVGSFGNQLAHGIPIQAFTGDQNDKELLYLSRYLKTVFSKDDPVADNQSIFGLNKIRFCKEVSQYIQGLKLPSADFIQLKEIDKE